MKKLYTLALLAISSFSFGQALYEPFDYATPGYIGGNLTTASDATGSNNWATHSNTATTGTGTIDVLSGSLSYAGLATSTGNRVLLPGNNATTPRDINRAITVSGTTVYYSTLINVIDNTQLSSTTPSYFMGLGTTAGANVTGLGARLGIVSSNSGANYRLSVQNTSGGTPTFTENAVDLTFGTTYLVVVKYDTAASPTVVTLWVNPSNLGATEPSSTVTNNSGTTAFATTASIFLRNNGTTPKVEIDEVRVGTTWAEVTPTGTASVNQNAISGLSVYPNPVKNGVFYINTDANAERTVAIFDVLGKQVYKTTTSQSAINVSSLNAGVYMVQVTEEGNTATRKLVIE